MIVSQGSIGWRRVNRSRRCPICGRPDWCGISQDGAAVICMRVESGKRTRNGGFLHRLHDRTDCSRRPRRIEVRTTEEPQDWTERARWLQVQADKLGKFEDLSQLVDVSTDTLRWFCVGWSPGGQWWSFPMFDGMGSCVTGIVRRWPNDLKGICRGHKAGLYMPANLPSNLSKLTLLVCEGATDPAAALDMGYWAVGRFSCRHGLPLIHKLVTQRRPRLVVVVSDMGNEIERKCAQDLAQALALHVPTKLVAPPAKDLRQWKGKGATTENLYRQIEAAPLFQVQVRVTI